MCNTAKQVIVSQEHKNQGQTQQIQTAHRLETILIVCGNEIRSAISYFKQFLRVLIIHLFIDQWDSGSRCTAECSHMSA